jgi:Holliday junction resolvase RusA-like endonuclease
MHGYTYTPKRTAAYEQLVQVYARKARVKKQLGEVVLTVSFFRGDNRKVDLDNLIKGCTDPLNGIAWDDDCQIVEQHAYKQVDKTNPRAEIEINALLPV